jgi:hypothetical protein
VRERHSQPNAIADSRPYSISHGSPHYFPHPVPDPSPHSDTDSSSDASADSCTYPHSHTNAYPSSHTYTHPLADSTAHTFSDAALVRHRCAWLRQGPGWHLLQDSKGLARRGLGVRLREHALVQQRMWIPPRRAHMRTHHKCANPFTSS